MKFDMNIKTKLTVSIGVLVAMIVLLVSLSVTNLQILTATEPDSPAGNEPCIDMDYDYRWHLYLHRFVDSV